MSSTSAQRTERERDEDDDAESERRKSWSGALVARRKPNIRAMWRVGGRRELGGGEDVEGHGRVGGLGASDRVVEAGVPERRLDEHDDDVERGATAVAEEQLG